MPSLSPLSSLAFTHQSLSPFKDGGYREYGLLCQLIRPLCWFTFRLIPCPVEWVGWGGGGRREGERERINEYLQLDQGIPV